MNVSVNASANLTDIVLPDSFNASTFVDRVIPDSANVCLYGKTLPQGFFGTITVFGKEVVLQNKHLNASSPATEFFDCAAIVLFDTPEGQFFERLQREAVRTQVFRGGGVVVEKRAATLARSDESVLGYAPGLEDVVPVKVDAPGNDARFLGEEVVSGSLQQVAADESLVGTPPTFFNNVSFTRVFQTGGTTVAYIRGSDSPTSFSLPAIIRSSPIEHNAVYYFAYPLEETPLALTNAGRFLASQYLGAYAFLRITG